MKLTFVGTRGYTRTRTQRHFMHTALLVEYRGSRVLIDCGADWLGHTERHRPQALLVTHAHPDHADGLAAGAPCPVYATDHAWSVLSGYPIEQRERILPRTPREIRGMTFEAFPVAHSVQAPAVGYRISAGRATCFYVPDVVFIEDRSEALRDIHLYIGDGATMTTSFVRKRGEQLIGHTPVRTQLTWCRSHDVPRAVFTHCGEEIVSGDEGAVVRELRVMADARGVRAQLAHDGLVLIL